MTFDELIDEVCAAVPMNNRTKAGAAINRAAKKIAYQVPFNVKVATITFASSKAVYDISTDFSVPDLGRILSFNRNDSSRSPVLELLESESVIGMAASGFTGLTTAYSVEGDDEVRFYPFPIIGNTLTLVYVGAYTDMAVASDTPNVFIDPNHQDTITYLAASRLAVRENIQKVRALKDLYLEELAEYRKWMKTRQGTSFSRIVVGYPGNLTRPFHDNSIYVRGS